MKQYDNFPLNESSNKQVIINIMYAQLSLPMTHAPQQQLLINWNWKNGSLKN
jgi:hypothetical protein